MSSVDMAGSRFAHTLVLLLIAIVAFSRGASAVARQTPAAAVPQTQVGDVLDVASGRVQLDEETLDTFLGLTGYEARTLPGGWRELRTPGSTTGDVQVTLAERPGSLTIVTNVGALEREADVTVFERALQDPDFPGAGQLFTREQRAVLVHRVALEGLTLARFEENLAAGRARAAALRALVAASVPGGPPGSRN